METVVNWCLKKRTVLYGILAFAGIAGGVPYRQLGKLEDPEFQKSWSLMPEWGLLPENGSGTKNVEC